MAAESGAQLLKRVGNRVRRRRLDLGLSIKGVAQRAAMSPRFLSDVEAGRGNIAIGRLSNLACALDLPLVSLVKPAAPQGARELLDELFAECSDAELANLLRLIQVARGKKAPAVIALLGVRGSGKTTVGSTLADKLGVPFVELARHIEAQASMPIGDIFSLHGEAYYRRVEQKCLVDLFQSGQSCVAALPGGIVGSPDALQLIRESSYSVWLRASVEDYWARVFAQGDTRPMDGRQDAMADLKALVAAREPLYRQADRVIETSGIPVDQVVSALLADLGEIRLRWELHPPTSSNPPTTSFNGA